MINLIGKLPTNGFAKQRNKSQIEGVVIHWDAQYRPPTYDALTRIRGQATYHINKDWGGGARGSGIMYHYAIGGDGEIYKTRKESDITWHVGNYNLKYIGVVIHCGADQEPTVAQVNALYSLLDELKYENVKAHNELIATECCGSIKKFVIKYRNKDMDYNIRDIQDVTVVAKKDLPIFDLVTNAHLGTFKKGTVITADQVVDYEGIPHYISKANVERGYAHVVNSEGFKAVNKAPSEVKDTFWNTPNGKVMKTLLYSASSMVASFFITETMNNPDLFGPMTVSINTIAVAIKQGLSSMQTS